MTELTQKEFASLGGTTTFKRHGSKHMRDIQKKSVEARLAKKKTDSVLLVDNTSDKS